MVRFGYIGCLFRHGDLLHTKYLYQDGCRLPGSRSSPKSRGPGLESRQVPLQCVGLNHRLSSFGGPRAPVTSVPPARGSTTFTTFIPP